MKALKPAAYSKEVYGGSVTPKTIRNWIKAGKKLPGVKRVETTPAGHYVLFMEERAKSNAELIAEQMKAKARAA